MFWKTIGGVFIYLYFTFGMIVAGWGGYERLTEISSLEGWEAVGSGAIGIFGCVFSLFCLFSYGYYLAKANEADIFSTKKEE